MISSKRIGLISIALIIAALIFTICVMVSPNENEIGEQVLSTKHAFSFTEDDYYTTHSQSGICKIDLNGDTAECASKNVLSTDDGITILGGGVYVLSGNYSKAITVDSADDGEVRLVLNGVNITAETPLCVLQAKKVILSLVPNSENTFTDTETRTDESITAALYAKDDLTINGSGTLVINANYADGIKANDKLKILESTLKINAKDEGINANDYIVTKNAVFDILSGGDGIKCEHEDSTLGFISLEASTLKLNCGDDGISASSTVYVNSDIDIPKCVEGIEGAYVEINGGNINIISRDDGLNAVGENSNAFQMPMSVHKENISDEEIYLKINSGNLKIETGGDGLDSNGAGEISGGRIEVYGPENSGNSSLDFQFGLIINGGTLLAAGSSGMAELPSDISKQNSIVFYLDETYKDSEIALNEVVSGKCNKNFNWICISSPDIKTGERYTLTIDGAEIATVTPEAVVTSSGNKSRSRFK